MVTFHRGVRSGWSNGHKGRRLESSMIGDLLPEYRLIGGRAITRDAARMLTKAPDALDDRAKLCLFIIVRGIGGRLEPVRFDAGFDRQRTLVVRIQKLGLL